jgi:alpha-beta hydrolase superfamily lysophospholipase
MQQVFQYLMAPHQRWKSVTVEKFVDPEDDHTFSVHWATPFPTEQQRVLYVIIPGMLNRHTDKYIEPFVHALAARGPTCVINYPLLADAATGTTIPNYSDERYLRHFLEIMNLRHPQCQLHLVGLSMGGTLAIKCHELATRVLAICSPVLGAEVWKTISGVYFGFLKTAFLAGPMLRLTVKNPGKWGTKLLDMARASNSQQLTKAVEAETQYNIYQMSIEELMTQLPVGKVMMAHTRDDAIIPYRPDDDPLFARVARITLATGSHLFFGATQARELVNTFVASNTSLERLATLGQ